LGNLKARQQQFSRELSRIDANWNAGVPQRAQTTLNRTSVSKALAETQISSAGETGLIASRDFLFTRFLLPLNLPLTFARYY
jgi:hypothetical protein